jgi:hypothetical protein
MPRFKKIELFDGNTYTVSTLPLSKTMAIRKLISKNKKGKGGTNPELEVLEKKLESEAGLTIEEMDRYDALSGFDSNIEESASIIRESLSIKHPEFKFTGDSGKDAIINKKIMDLVDIDDLKHIAEFALSGVWSTDEQQAGSQPKEG